MRPLGNLQIDVPRFNRMTRKAPFNNSLGFPSLARGVLIETMELAEGFKEIIRAGKRPPKILERKNFFRVFYASSTRTRGAFEAGMELLCGHAPHTDVTTTRIGAGEGKKN